MVSTRPPTSKSTSLFNYPLVIVPNEPISIDIIVTWIFHSFYQFPSKVEVLFLLFSFFQFYSVVSRDSKIDNFTSYIFFFFLLTVIRSGLLAETRWSVCMSKSHKSLCVLLSRTDAGLCIYPLSVWSKLNFLPISSFICQALEIRLVTPNDWWIVLFCFDLFFFFNLFYDLNMSYIDTILVKIHQEYRQHSAT